MRTTSVPEVEDIPLIGPVLVAGGLVFAELLIVMTYLELTSTGVTKPRYLIYPFIWINIGLLAIYLGTARAGSRRHRLLGLGIAGGYYLLLLVVAGNISFEMGAEPALGIIWATPGWGPVLSGGFPGVDFQLIPYEVVGYAGLAYLLYVNVLDVSRGILPGILGIVTCVSCSMPLWGPILGLVGGGAMGLSQFATTYAYDIGTAIFLVTMGLLYYFHRRSIPEVSPDGL